MLGFLGFPALASRRLAQALIEIGMLRFQMIDDLEVLFLHPAEIDALDMDKPQQLAHGLGHRAAAFVTRATALCHADPGPEFFLVQTQTPADFPRVDEFKQLHGSLQYRSKIDNAYANSMDRARAKKDPPAGLGGSLRINGIYDKIQALFSGHGWR